jgi:hypothetical protein
VPRVELFSFLFRRDIPRPNRVPPIPESKFTAGPVAGTLDLTLAIIFFAVHERAPFTAVPQAVASGLPGARAFRLGIAAALLGIFVHYFIALTVADIYYAASLRLKFLNRQLGSAEPPMESPSTS